MKTITLKGLDGSPFNVCIWDEVANPKAIIQIAHGMAEYIARYDRTAQAFNALGYVVLGDDHRGHGQTCGFDKRGITTGDSFFDTVNDMSVLTQYAIDTYKLPVFLLGHSYGSFLSQAYIQQYGSLLQGCILSGSAYMNSSLVAMGGFIAKLQHAFIHGYKKAKLIEKLSFGSYDKPFPAEEQPFAWLTRDRNEVEMYRKDDYCGHVMSINFQSSFLNGVHSLYTSDRLDKIPRTLPLLIVSGDRDPVGGDGKLVKQLYQCYLDVGISDVKMKLYPEARHEILNETNREEVRSDIDAFITEKLSK